MENSGGIGASLSGRYATALFGLAREEKQIEAVESSLTKLRAALDQSDDFRTLTSSPVLSRGDAANGIAAERVNKVGEPSPNVLDVIGKRSVDLVINDFRAGRGPTDNYRIRRAAVEASIASLTSLDTAHALVTALESEAGPPR